MILFSHLFDWICRQRLEDMRRLYNADVSEACTPDQPFANVNEMIAAMIPANSQAPSSLAAPDM